MESGILLVACGLFALGSAISNWGPFMNHRKAQLLIRMVGETGTRVFYSILGAAFIVFGVLIGLEVI